MEKHSHRSAIGLQEQYGEDIIKAKHQETGLGG